MRITTVTSIRLTLFKCFDDALLAKSADDSDFATVDSLFASLDAEASGRGLFD
jgi:hypothetical protein